MMKNHLLTIRISLTRIYNNTRNPKYYTYLEIPLGHIMHNQDPTQQIGKDFNLYLGLSKFWELYKYYFLNFY